MKTVELNIRELTVNRIAIKQMIRRLEGEKKADPRAWEDMGYERLLVAAKSIREKLD